MNRVLTSTLCVLLFAATSFAQTTRPADDELATVVSEGLVAAPVDEVWKVFSTDDGYRKLGVAKAKIDLRPGGMLWSTYDPNVELGSEASIGTEILAIDPGRTIATHIKQPPKGFPFTTAYRTVTNVISLTDLGDGRTNVRVAMNGFDASDESQKMREFFRTGNAWVIQKLQSNFGGEAPQRSAHANGELDPLEFTQLVQAPRVDVWKLYTTSEGWKQFFHCDDAQIGDQPGGPFTPFGGTEGNTVLSLVPGEMYSHTWNAPPQFAFAKGQHAWVVVTFEAVSPTTTRVRLRHYGFNELATKYADHADEFKHSRKYFAEKWPLVMKGLAGVFEKGAT